MVAVMMARVDTIPADLIPNFQLGIGAHAILYNELPGILGCDEGIVEGLLSAEIVDGGAGVGALGAVEMGSVPSKHTIPMVRLPSLYHLRHLDHLGILRQKKCCKTKE